MSFQSIDVRNPWAMSYVPPVTGSQKKRQHEAGVKLLRQVSYRQETYRAVMSLYAKLRKESKLKV
jgi:hypothetical protein